MVMSLSAEIYDRLWQELVALQPESALEYFRYHRRRYHELFNNLAYYLAGKSSPAVLEVGVSGFLPLYKKIFPVLSLVTMDRPIELNGIPSDYCMRICQAERHYSIDLNKDFPSRDWGSPPLGMFDCVICTEVIEHLIVNPVEFLSSLLGLLKPEGYLYLTTPNFLSYYHLQQIKQRENPQLVMPKRGSDKDAAHHFREYAMNELLRFASEAGGQVVKAYYSDCWDDERLIREVLSKHPEQKSNLVVVATLASGGASDTEIASSQEVVESCGSEDRLASEMLAELNYALAERDAELARLRELVAGYERGRFIRAMKWLHERRRGR